MNLQNILEKIETKNIIGNVNVELSDVIQLDASNEREDIITWCSTKFKDVGAKLTKGCLVLEEESLPEVKKGDVTYIVVDNARLAFQKILKAFYELEKSNKKGVEKSAFVAETAIIDPTAYIAHNVVIEEHVVVGKNTMIDSNTVLKAKTKIGENCFVGANCTIGAVGFGYERNEEGEFELLPHLGNVVLENFVEIGNNTCVDRGVMGSTILREGSKVDNQVHIAHGVDVGRRSFVIANAMVAGSVTIGEDVWVAPSSCIINGIEIGDNSTIGLGAVVVKPVEDKQVVVGNPAKPLSSK